MDQEYIKRLDARISELEASVRYLKRALNHRVSENGLAANDHHNPMLTVTDVVNLLGLPRHIIYAKATSGEIPSLRIGKRYKFGKKEVLEWFEGKFHAKADVDDFVDKYLQRNVLIG
jgi:excisionase family DNA binding protein